MGGGHSKKGVCVCVFMQGREKGWIVVLAGPVLHLEEIASLAHLSPLLSAVIISMAKSNLADVMYKTLKECCSSVCLFFWCQGRSIIRRCNCQQTVVNRLLIC